MYKSSSKRLVLYIYLRSAEMPPKITKEEYNRLRAARAQAASEAREIPAQKSSDATNTADLSVANNVNTLEVPESAQAAMDMSIDTESVVALTTATAMESVDVPSKHVGTRRKRGLSKPETIDPAPSDGAALWAFSPAFVAASAAMPTPIPMPLQIPIVSGPTVYERADAFLSDAIALPASAVAPVPVHVPVNVPATEPSPESSTESSNRPLSDSLSSAAITAQLQTQSDQIMGLTALVTQRDDELNRRNRIIRDLEQTQEDLRDRQRRTADDLDRKRDELKATSEELQLAQRIARDAQVARAEAEANLLPLQFQLAALQKDRDLQDQSLQVLQKELEERSNLQASWRMKHAEGQIEIAALKSAHAAQLEAAQRQLQTMTQAHDKATAMASSLATELTHLTATHSSSTAEAERKLLQEQQQHASIVSMHTKHTADALEKISALEARVATLVESLSISEAEVQKERETVNTISVQSSNAMEDMQRSVREWQEKVESLASQNTALHQSLMLQSSGTSQMGSSDSTVIGRDLDPELIQEHGLNISGIGGLSDAYARVLQAERALIAEASKRRSAEAYLNKILNTMESTAPKRLQEKEQYRRVLEQNEHLSSNVQSLRTQLEQTTQDLKAREQQVHELTTDVQLLSATCNDSRAQITHLLQAQHAGKGHSAIVEDAQEAARSSGLLYDDVSALQLKNEQLIRVVRKLEYDQQALLSNLSAQGLAADGELSLGQGGGLATLHQALVELANMKAARERTEEMVLGLVQQRDMFKSLLDAQTVEVTTLMSPASKRTNDAQSPKGVSVVSAHDSPSVITLQEQLRVCQDRLAGAQEAEKSLSQALENSRSAAGTLRVEAARATGEARFEKERNERLEASLRTAQVEVASVKERCSTLEGRALELQAAVRTSEEKGHTATARCSELSALVQKLNAKLASATSVQKHLEDQVAALNADSGRQASLAESVRRIESSLALRFAQEKEGLVLERDSLARTTEDLRRQAAESGVRHEQRCLALEDELRVQRAKVAAQTGEIERLREGIAREEAATKAASDRVALLGKQLASATDKLEALAGNATIDAVLQRELDQQTAKVASLTSELAQERQAMLLLRESESALRRMKDVATSTLVQLQERTAASAAIHTADVDAARTAAATAQASLRDLRAAHTSLLLELESTRETSQRALREATTRTQEIEQSQEEVLARAQEAMRHEAALVAEIAAAHKQVKQERENYEREQAQHAATAAARRSLQQQLEVAQRIVPVATADASMAAAPGAGSEVFEGVTATSSLIASYEQRLQLLTATNAQLVDETKRLADRISGVEQAAFVSAAAASASSAVSLSAEHTHELRQHCAVLVESVKQHQLQETALQERLAASEKEASRTLLLLRTAQASLAELREELNATRASDGVHDIDAAGGAAATNAPVTNAASVAKTPAARGRHPRTPASTGAGSPAITPASAGNSSNVNTPAASLSKQLKLAMDSNEYLQQQNASLLQQLNALQEQVAALQAQNAPLHDSIRLLKADCVAACADRDHQRSEVVFWKEKYMSYLTSQGKVEGADGLRDANVPALMILVDQATYTALQEKCDSLQNDVLVLQQQAQEVVALRGALAEVQSQLLSAQELERAIKARADTEKADWQQSNRAAAQQTQALQAQISELLSQMQQQAAAHTAAAAALQVELDSQKMRADNAEKTSEKRYDMLKAMKERFTSEKQAWGAEKLALEEAAQAANKIAQQAQMQAEAAASLKVAAQKPTSMESAEPVFASSSVVVDAVESAVASTAGPPARAPLSKAAAKRELAQRKALTASVERVAAAAKSFSNSSIDAAAVIVTEGQYAMATDEGTAKVSVVPESASMTSVPESAFATPSVHITEPATASATVAAPAPELAPAPAPASTSELAPAPAPASTSELAPAPAPASTSELAPALVPTSADIQELAPAPVATPVPAESASATLSSPTEQLAAMKQKMLAMKRQREQATTLSSSSSGAAAEAGDDAGNMSGQHPVKRSRPSKSLSVSAETSEVAADTNAVAVVPSPKAAQVPVLLNPFLKAPQGGAPANPFFAISTTSSTNNAIQMSSPDRSAAASPALQTQATQSTSGGFMGSLVTAGATAISAAMPSIFGSKFPASGTRTPLVSTSWSMSPAPPSDPSPASSPRTLGGLAPIGFVRTGSGSLGSLFKTSATTAQTPSDTEKAPRPFSFGFLTSPAVASLAPAAAPSAPMPLLNFANGSTALGAYGSAFAPAVTRVELEGELGEDPDVEGNDEAERDTWKDVEEQ